MKLNHETQVILWDLMECYHFTSKDRVKQSLISVMIDKLIEEIEGAEQYTRYSLRVEKHTLTFNVIVSPDEDDETEYDEPDATWMINLENGKCRNG